MSKKDKARSKKTRRKPKKKCCVSKPRCSRCPLRMLAEGTLPEGYTVKKRRLVTLDGGAPVRKDTSKPKDKSKHKDTSEHKSKPKHKGKRAA